jgi:phenylacetate-coenzyme A ligase PaaK-like adenylate-forming protein
MSVITNTIALAQLLADSRRSNAELEPTITKRLRKLLVAAVGVPRHREAMRQAAYDPQRDFSGLGDLAFLPVMTKADLKSTPDAFLQVSASGRLDGHATNCLQVTT